MAMRDRLMIDDFFESAQQNKNKIQNNKRAYRLPEEQ